MVRVIFLFVLFTKIISSQPLSEIDYQAGPIAYGKYVQPLLPMLPKANKISMEDVPQTGGRATIDGRDTLLPPDTMYIYEFDSLTIQTNGFGIIQSFDFTKREYKTKRGICIGDSVAKVRRMYGPDPGGSSGEYFEEGHARSIRFYIADGRVVRIAMGAYHP